MGRMLKLPKAYSKADDVEIIAEDLIRKHHPHLLGVRIDYIFISETPVSKEKEVWGRARLINGLNAYQSGSHEGGEPKPYFLIEISSPIWDRLSEAQRAALVDHELSHCWAEEESEDSDELKLKLGTHDVEEFAGVVRRHGLWREAVAHFVEVGKEQMELFERQPKKIDQVLEAVAEQVNAGALNRNGVTVTMKTRQVA